MPKNENTYNPWDRLLVAVIMVRKNKNYSCVFVCPRKSIIGAGGMVKSNGCFSTWVVGLILSTVTGSYDAAVLGSQHLVGGGSALSRWPLSSMRSSPGSRVS